MHETSNLISAASKLSSVLQTDCAAQDGPYLYNLPDTFHNECESQNPIC